MLTCASLVIVPGQTSSSSVLPLNLSSLAASSKEVYPSTPRPPPAVASPTVSPLLQALPDPLFLPHPFTPSDPLFASVASLAAIKLVARREELEQELVAIIGEKRAALAEAERSVQREVMIVWEAYRSHRTPSRPASSLPLAGKPSGSSSDVVGRAPVTRDTGFAAGSRGSLSVERRAEAKSPSPTSLKIGVPQTTAFAKVSTPTGSPPSGGQASLLGASLARTSHMQAAAAAASPTSSAPARSPLSPVSSQPSNSASPAALTGASIPSKKRERRPSNQDLDLATSMRLSHMPSPPNLIFSTTNARAGATLVREGDDVKSRSFEERAALLAAQPVVLTPPAEETEGPEGGEGGEPDLAFRESPGEAAHAVEAAAEPPAEIKPSATANEAKRDGGTPKRVTFKEDDLPPDDDDEEEGTVVGEQEDVFDFEPHSQASASSSPPTSPGGPADFASLVRPTARSLERSDAGDEPSLAATSSSTLKQEPLYTLDGRSIHPVSASSPSPARAFSTERSPRSRGEDEEDENKVVVSMRRLTAADLPSHRASYKDSTTNGVRKWAMYGRIANARSPASKDSEGASHSEDTTEGGPCSTKCGCSRPVELAYQGGQSLPIPLAFPPSASLMTTPFERKTSLTDREMYVPPLRPAMRSAGSSTASSSKAPSAASSPPRAHTYSQSVGANMDPGPLFDEDDGSETNSGFVAPHLKALEGGRSGDAIGWASMVNR